MSARKQDLARLLASDEEEALVCSGPVDEREPLVVVDALDADMRHLRLEVGAGEEDPLARVTKEAEVDTFGGNVEVGHGGECE